MTDNGQIFWVGDWPEAVCIPKKSDTMTLLFQGDIHHDFITILLQETTSRRQPLIAFFKFTQELRVWFYILYQSIFADENVIVFKSLSLSG